MNPENPIIPADLLSIDVDAHLQKLAANTFGSRFHYPVELVRSALKRGAQQVEITINLKDIEIRDDGRGIEKEQLALLRDLLAPGQPAAVREQSIEKMKTPQGIGLLAIFSPSPTRIRIENVTKEARESMLIEKGRLKETGSYTIKSGTRITIDRTSSNRNREEVILKDYCRAVTQDILLNGKAIEKKSIFIPPVMVSMRLKNSPGIGGGVVGIPEKGDLCKIWLLDQGIPWYHLTIRPWKGFIFSAAVEFKEEVTRSFLNQLVEPVTRLYYWLARRYPTYPESYQARVEELLFKHNRISSHTGPVNCFSPFKVFNSPDRLGLSQVIKKTAAGNLYAVPAKENPKKYNAKTGKTLLLSSKQIDFLVNHHRIPLTFLTPVKYHKNPLRIFHKLTEKVKNIISHLIAAGRKRINRGELGGLEDYFLKALVLHLNTGSNKPHVLLPDQELEAVMINARGLSPAVLKPPLLLINRKHPLVKKAILAYRLDPRSIELAARALL